MAGMTPENHFGVGANSGRLVSLDLFRGATIAFMIFVNSVVENDGLHFGPFAHGRWGTATPTDWVFPLFLFIVGVAMPFSFEKRLAVPGGRALLYVQIVKRTALLVLLGWLINLTPAFKWSELRVLGVLPRIGLCYFFTSLIVLNLNRKAQIGAVAILLLTYWALMAWVPFPGKGGTWEAGTATQANNLAQYIDRRLLGIHLSAPNDFESKGILSTLSAITNTLVGYLCGVWLRSSRAPLERSNGLFVWGTIFVVAALFWHDLGVPFHQGLWTPSFAVMMSGLGMLLLAAFYWRVDIQGRLLGNRIFVVFGSNALLAFVGHQLLNRILTGSGGTISPRTFIYNHWLQPWAGDLGGSVVYGLVMVAFWWAVCACLHRRQIIVKL
jgi:predicted acyltransferase